MARKTYVTDDGEVITESPALAIVEIKPPFFKTPWNHNTNAESDRVALDCSNSPSKTQQQFAAESDINNILRKFMETGDLPVKGPPTYADIEKQFDLQDNMVTQWQVHEAWEALPDITKQLLGDPSRFLAYVEAKLAAGDVEGLRAVGLGKKAKEPPQKIPGDPKAGPGDTPDPEPPKPPQEPPAAVT